MWDYYTYDDHITWSAINEIIILMSANQIALILSCI